MHARRPVVVLTRSGIHSVFDTSVDDTALDGRPPTKSDEVAIAAPGSVLRLELFSPLDAPTCVYGDQRRHSTLWIDCEVFRLALVVRAEVESHSVILRTCLLQCDVRGQRACTDSVEQLEHQNLPSLGRTVCPVLVRIPHGVGTMTSRVASQHV